MCGIAGIFHFASSSRVDDHVLTAMRDTMIHRGPNGGQNWISDDGRVGLSHRRLSILDLNANAAQPLPNEDETIWIAFNGEIYNHLPLRRELIDISHRFITDHADTETIVHGYEQWGIDGLLERLDGDYGIAIWDGNREIMTLARDRVGVKPLYFALHNGMLLFGSEIKAILAHPAMERDIDPMAMYHYLTFLTTPAPMTMFRGIYKLPAGHYLQMNANGSLSTCKYWDAVPGRGIRRDELQGLSDMELEDFYVEGIRGRLTDAVRKRMMSDVPVGVFLSGGVDSSTNVALMSAASDRPVNTFTVGFKDFDHLNELDHARSIAEKFGTNHHEVMIDENDMVGYLDSLIHHQDEPIADWVCIPLYFVSKLAHDNGVRVIQVGEGSDEQFCGYASYMAYLRLYHRYWRPFQRFLPQKIQEWAGKVACAAAGGNPALAVYADIIDRAARRREHFWSGAMAFGETLKKRLVYKKSLTAGTTSPELLHGLLPASYLQPDTFNIIESFLAPFDEKYPGSCVLTRMAYNEFKLRLPELLLMRVDKITMSTSIEARVPFLDHRLVEFTMDIPTRWKVHGGEPKYLLKKAVEGLLPREIVYRKKMGFGAPMSEWLRGEFGRQAEAGIMESKLMERGYFNLVFIKKLIDNHRKGGEDNSLYIWMLFNLTAWYDYWVDP